MITYDHNSDQPLLIKTSQDDIKEQNKELICPLRAEY